MVRLDGNQFYWWSLIAAFAALIQGVAIMIDHFVYSALRLWHLALLTDVPVSIDMRQLIAPLKERGRSCIYVLAGGLMAALFGPEIAHNTVQWVPGYLYAGCYFLASAVQLISLLVLAGVKIPKPKLTRKGGRPLGVFFRNPEFVVGMTCSAIGYALMSYMMTATPLQVVNVAQLGTSANATIIQWHVVAMFAPSFLLKFDPTMASLNSYGWLIAYIVAMITALAVIVLYYPAALFPLGLGWNFLYIGGSALVASGTAEEKGRVQGWLIWQQYWSLWHRSAGGLHSQFGWDIFILAGCVLAAIWLVV